jgi:hypothetical protein
MGTGMRLAGNGSGMMDTGPAFHTKAHAGSDLGTRVVSFSRDTGKVAGGKFPTTIDGIEIAIATMAATMIGIATDASLAKHGAAPAAPFHSFPLLFC